MSSRKIPEKGNKLETDTVLDVSNGNGGKSTEDSEHDDDEYTLAYTYPNIQGSEHIEDNDKLEESITTRRNAPEDKLENCFKNADSPVSVDCLAVLQSSTVSKPQDLGIVDAVVANYSIHHDHIYHKNVRSIEKTALEKKKRRRQLAKVARKARKNKQLQNHYASYLRQSTIPNNQHQNTTYVHIY